MEATDDADNPFRTIAAWPQVLMTDTSNSNKKELKSVFKYIPVFVDFDGDGDDDLVLGGGDFDTSLRYAERKLVNGQVTYSEIQASYYTGPENPGNAKLARWRNHPIHQIQIGDQKAQLYDYSYPAHPAFLDFNDDGDLDVVVGSRDGTLRFWIYARTNMLCDKRVIPCYVERTGDDNPFGKITVEMDSAPVFLRDLNGDKVLELAVGSTGGDITLFASNFCQSACSSEGICRKPADQTFRQTCSCLPGEGGASGTLAACPIAPAHRVAMHCAPPPAITLPAIVSVLPSCPHPSSPPPRSLTCPLLPGTVSSAPPGRLFSKALQHIAPGFCQMQMHCVHR